MLFFFDFKMGIGFELPRNFVGFLIFGHIILGRARDNQRCSCFVDKNVVDFVDDGVVQNALGLLLKLGITVVTSRRLLHVVAQIVEAELVVGSVGNVASISLLPLLRLHSRPDCIDR